MLENFKVRATSIKGKSPLIEYIDTQAYEINIEYTQVCQLMV